MAVVFFRPDNGHAEPAPGPAEPFPNEPGDLPPADPQPVVSEPAADPGPQPDDPGAEPPAGDSIQEAALESVLQTFQIQRQQEAMIELLLGLNHMINSTTMAVRASASEDMRTLAAVNRVLVFSLQGLAAALLDKLPKQTH